MRIFLHHNSRLCVRIRKLDGMIHVHVDQGKNIKSVVENEESEGKQRICVRFDDATDVKIQ